MILLLLLLMQLFCHSVIVVVKLVQTKQIKINIHKRNNAIRSTNNTKHSKYKYIHYQNTHTFLHGYNLASVISIILLSN